MTKDQFGRLLAALIKEAEESLAYNEIEEELAYFLDYGTVVINNKIVA